MRKGDADIRQSAERRPREGAFLVGEGYLLSALLLTSLKLTLRLSSCREIV